MLGRKNREGSAMLLYSVPQLFCFDYWPITGQDSTGFIVARADLIFFINDIIFRWSYMSHPVYSQQSFANTHVSVRRRCTDGFPPRTRPRPRR